MRSVSQIYSEAVATRNSYLQLTELNSGRSNSKLSMLNLVTYVVAVCIHTYETLLDLFQVKLAETLNGRINGTPDWYAVMARKFQYNSVTEQGDELVFNEDTMKIEYTEIDTSHRIIEKAAWETGDDGDSIVLKVCKANDNSNELNNGIPYSPLNYSELTAFRMFIRDIKFLGATIYCESNPGDILTVVADRRNPIFYDDSYITAAQALSGIQAAMIDFVNGMEFNGMLYYQSVLDAIRKTEHIVDIGNSLRVYLSSYNTKDGAYDSPVELIGRARLKGGYVRLLDTDGSITVNTDNLTLVPASRMDEYYTSLTDSDA